MAESGQQVLADAVAAVRSRIEKLRERGGRIGEQDTKAILIEPVLAALGWDLAELDDVRREYRHKRQDNPVDYALLIYGKPCLFVEAKAYGSTLDRKCALQVLGYASAVGVAWCLVTDGDEYQLYNSGAAVDLEEKLFRSLRLSDEKGVSCLETLALLAKERMGETELDALWKSQFVDRRVGATLEMLFGGEDEGLARLVHKRSSELGLAEVRDSLRRASVQVHFPQVTPARATSEPKQSQVTPQDELPATEAAARRGVEIADLIAAGLIVPPLRLERRYKGVELQASIEADGTVRWQGSASDSLSAAAGMARASVIGTLEGGKYPATNGWTFWQYRDARDGVLHPLAELRERYRQSSIQPSSSGDLQ